MNPSTKAVFLSVTAGGLLAGGLLFGALAIDDKPILIESRESKTRDGQPVFNQIRWFNFPERDVWMMNQSHFGRKANSHEWERLAIVIDKTKRPHTARFYQVESGPLEWLNNAEFAKEVSFRAACFMCHSNGPRAIRPEINSTSAPLGWWDKSRVAMWNLRIKSYGRIVPHEDHARAQASLDDLKSGRVVPFRYPGILENQTLELETCTTCHNDSKWGRGKLTRQQAGTIQFLVEQKEMPPLGFSMTEGEQRHLKKFMKGL